MPEDGPPPPPTSLKLFKEVTSTVPSFSRSVFFWREGSSLTSPDTGDLALGKKAETTLRAASAFSASWHTSLHEV